MSAKRVEARVEECGAYERPCLSVKATLMEAAGFKIGDRVVVMSADEAAQLDAAEHSWMETAAHADRGREYYRALLMQIGELFGAAAKTSDDGSVQQDVLVAKVPELVAELIGYSQGRQEVIDLFGLGRKS